MAKISIPFNLEEPEQEEIPKLQPKEIKAKEHLEEMSEITRHLGYNDIKMLRKNVAGKGRKIEEKEAIYQEQDIQKERQE